MEMEHEGILEEPAQANDEQVGPPAIIIHDAPKLDLDAYISNYEGRTRLERLRTIGTCSRVLGPEALLKAAQEASTGKDYNLFNNLRGLYNEIAPEGQAGKLNNISVAKMKQHTQRETEKLENDLKGYKNNLIKESIRLGNDDLGQHYYNAGNFSEAFRAFGSMQEHCTMPKHAAEMSMKLILTAVAQRSWQNVSSNVQRVVSLSLRPEEKEKFESVRAPLLGLSYLEGGNYKDAADAFLETESTYGTAEPLGGVKPSTMILSPNDVATYGGLCALATLSRQDLTRRVLENAEFRSFLELESHLRRAIVHFCNSKYTQCLEILESYRTDYLLDMHLQRHVEALYTMIRRKSIIAYCAPFSEVSIAAMGSAFGATEADMEAELLRMIKNEDLKARLDLVDKLLVANDEDRRSTSHANAVRMAEKYEHMLRLKLFKLNMAQLGFEYKGLRGMKESDGMAMKGARPMGQRGW